MTHLYHTYKYIDLISSRLNRNNSTKECDCAEKQIQIQIRLIFYVD